jgi:hypothetical protein
MGDLLQKNSINSLRFNIKSKVNEIIEANIECLAVMDKIQNAYPFLDKETSDDLIKTLLKDIESQLKHTFR